MKNLSQKRSDTVVEFKKVFRTKNRFLNLTAFN